MSNVLEFPAQVRVQDFMAEEAVKQQVRQCLGCAVGLFHGQPGAADMILAPEITGADNKVLILTKATQRRGDYVTLISADADGYMATEMRGVWAREG
jgi:predicted TPR repeat methyltransferase